MTSTVRMLTSLENEERVILWALLGTVAFFLLAATSINPSNQNSKSRRKANATMDLLLRQQYETARETIFAHVYRKTFLRLRDEHERFLPATQAKAILPGPPGIARGARCGSWRTDIPRLVLRTMKVRCPPPELS